MTDRSKLLSILGALGIAAGTGVATTSDTTAAARAQGDDAAAFANALAESTDEALEAFLRQYPDSEFAPAAFERLPIILAQGKSRSDRGESPPGGGHGKGGIKGGGPYN